MSDPMLNVLAKRDRRETPCKVCLWLATAPQDRADALVAALKDPSMGINTIKRALEAGGVRHIQNTAIKRCRDEEHHG